MKRGIVRINAGAGAGKTLVVVMRVIRLLMSGVKPEEILLITFTNTGAAEMRDRIKLYADDFGIEADISKIMICTFNAFGDMILKENFEKFGFSKPPKVADNIDRTQIINDLLSEEPRIKGLDYRHYSMKNKYVYGALPMVQEIFSIQKTKMYDSTDASKVVSKIGAKLSLSACEEIMELYDKYDDKMREENLIEFADQETMIFELFNREPYYLEKFGFKHLIVDEFQDSNEKEIKIIKLLRDTPCFESLMVVGDDSQAIFSFKDTTPDYIINFEDAMKEKIDTINLLHNYRSQANIIDFANQINELNVHRVEKDLIATRPAGKPVVVQGFLTDEQQYDYVVKEIKKKLEEGYNYEDIAILVRKRKSIPKYVDLLTKEGIPTQIASQEVIIENCRVIAAIGLISVIEDEKNTSDLLKYLNAKLHGKLMEKSVEEIQEMVEDTLCEIEMLPALTEAEQKEKVMEMLYDIDSNEDEIYNHFLESLDFRPTLQKMIEYVNVFRKFGQNESYRRKKVYPGIKIMTAHASKGLEWPVVFNDINDYEDSFLKRGYETPESEEQRRLFFVSSTRARDELYVVGTYIAIPKKNDNTFNRFLKEAYDIKGQAFVPSSIETQLDLYKKELKQKKAEERKALKEKKAG